VILFEGLFGLQQTIHIQHILQIRFLWDLLFFLIYFFVFLLFENGNMLFVCHTFSVEDPDFRIQAIGQETVYDLFLILVCTAYRYTSFDKLRKTLRRRSPCYVHKCTCKVIQKFIIFLPGLVKGRILIHNTVYKFIIVFCLSADNQFHFRNAN
jgi:hypothetical protein